MAAMMGFSVAMGHWESTPAAGGGSWAWEIAATAVAALAAAGLATDVEVKVDAVAEAIDETRASFFFGRTRRRIFFREIASMEVAKIDDGEFPASHRLEIALLDGTTVDLFGAFSDTGHLVSLRARILTSMVSAGWIL